MRRVLVTFAVASAFTAAVAQSDPVVERNDLMKLAGQQFYGVTSRMARGDAPFDQAKADAAFATLETLPQKFKPLFEVKSDKAAPNSRYRSSPKIWDSKKEFDDYFVAFAKAVAENKSKTKTIDDLKIAAKAVGDVCSACHEKFQVRN